MHAGNHSARDQVPIDQGELLGIDRQLVAEDVTMARSGQVPVAVVGQVQNGLLIRLGLIADP